MEGFDDGEKGKPYKLGEAYKSGETELANELGGLSFPQSHIHRTEYLNNINTLIRSNKLHPDIMTLLKNIELRN